jgi:hypothetical protein
MGIGSKLLDFLAGGTAKTILDGVKAYFPPSMSEQEKSELSLKISEAQKQYELTILDKANEADAEFNTRIKEMEGTASDLKSIPYIGGLVIFLRGLQRPFWGFATLYLDFKSFSQDWVLTDQQDFALLMINILVLGFLFGERALKNVMPLINAYFGKQK